MLLNFQPVQKPYIRGTAYESKRHYQLYILKEFKRMSDTLQELSEIKIINLNVCTLFQILLSNICSYILFRLCQLQNIIIYVICTLHCDIIILYKPKKCTIFGLLTSMHVKHTILHIQLSP